jgi:hypothetical protein
MAWGAAPALRSNAMRKHDHDAEPTQKTRPEEGQACRDSGGFRETASCSRQVNADRKRSSLGATRIGDLAVTTDRFRRSTVRDRAARPPLYGTEVSGSNPAPRAKRGGPRALSAAHCSAPPVAWPQSRFHSGIPSRMATVSKTADGLSVVREFESLPLRLAAMTFGARRGLNA